MSNSSAVGVAVTTPGSAEVAGQAGANLAPRVAAHRFTDSLGPRTAWGVPR